MPQGYKKDGTKLVPPKMGGWNKGIKRYWKSPTEIKKGQHVSPSTEFKKGMVNQKGENNSGWKGGISKIIRGCKDCGIKCSDYTALRCRKCSEKFRSMENHSNWKGGVDNRVRRKLAPYPPPMQCEICRTPSIDMKKGLFLDHDHKTNKFRGWLCVHCNSALGFAKDNIEILQEMIKYLERSYE